jgi:hypothetical protein
VAEGQHRRYDGVPCSAASRYGGILRLSTLRGPATGACHGDRLRPPGELEHGHARAVALRSVASRWPRPVGVLHVHIVLGAQSIWMFGLTHFWGTTSRRLSTSAWTDTEMVLGSPMTQPWL